MTAGTNQAATLSASRCSGARDALRLCDQRDDLRQQTVRADALGATITSAGLVDRRADDAIARALVHRHGLARQHRFVDAGTAVEDAAVDRYLLARPNAQPIAGVHVIERHVLFGAVRFDPPRGLRRKAKQLPDRRARACRALAAPAIRRARRARRSRAATSK